MLESNKKVLLFMFLSVISVECLSIPLLLIMERLFTYFNVLHFLLETCGGLTFLSLHICHRIPGNISVVWFLFKVIRKFFFKP